MHGFIGLFQLEDAPTLVSRSMGVVFRWLVWWYQLRFNHRP